eukprot:TRINITY_DN1450_c0_g1_i1.p1 TRINITY_DN1450_c0_g1~~TRINITY_DN1450_c0_g1_i1.p1  ORF type:complete len:347 (-),score=94.09 TRINITY_DN1450_c0_g1_i1:78-1097(-)
MPSQEIYIPKVILVTGGAGFIASHVTIHLVNTYPDYHIIVLDSLEYCASKNNLKDCWEKPNFTFVEGNITNTELVRHLMKVHNIDTVMHFAAESHVDNSFGNSIIFTQTNVLGTHILLECAKEHNIKRFIHVSTDEVYGEVSMDHDGHLENATLEPTNPYSCSKAAAEFICKAYIRSYHQPVIITRSNNVYGTHQYPEKVIPKFVYRLDKGIPLCIHGDGSNVRSFIHVSDVVAGFDTILHQGDIHEIYNIGLDNDVSVLEVAELILKEMGLFDKKDELIEFVEDRPFNDLRYAIKSDKLTKLGWAPKKNFSEGLQETVQWYLKNKNHWEFSERAYEDH